MNLGAANVTQARYRLSPLICVIALAAGPSLCAAKPPTTVFGEYAGIGCRKKGPPDSCLPTKSTDRVRILHGASTDARVRVRIVFDRGHVCSLEGDAEWSGDRFTLRADGLDPAKPCQLVLHISGSVLTLEDPEGRCREVYCGTRGALDGARFKKVGVSSNRRKQ